MIRDPRGGYNRKKVNESFFKKWCPKMAYVLGFMFADGSLVDSNKSSRTYYLSFSNNDFYTLNAIREAMKSTHKIYREPAHIMKHKARMYRSKPGYELRFGNKIMYHDLLKLGMKHRKSRDMLLPMIPGEFFPFFLRGYFDGDGCVNLYFKRGQKTPRLSVVFTSGSTIFLDNLSRLLSERLNIGHIKYYQSTGAYNLQTNGLNAYKILGFMYVDLFKAPYMRRKYLKFCEYRDKLIGPRIKKSLT